MAVKRRGRLHVWAMPAFLLTVALFSLQLISAQVRPLALNSKVHNTPLPPEASTLQRRKTHQDLMPKCDWCSTAPRLLRWELR